MIAHAAYKVSTNWDDLKKVYFPINFYKFLSIKAKKIRNCFSGYLFFKKNDAAGWVFILILFSSKTDAGTFFSKLGQYFLKSCALAVILSDSIQIRP